MNSKEEVFNKFITYCHFIHAQGLVSGSGGNVSMRCGQDILITPTGRSLKVLKTEDIICLHQDGSYASPTKQKPSKEWRMHLQCYKYDGIHAVIHVHSVYATAVSCLKQLDMETALPMYTPSYAMRVGHLTAVPYYTPGSEALANAVDKIIAVRNSVMMCNHGILAVGPDLETALNIIEEIEENAKMYFILNGQGKALEKSQIETFPLGMRMPTKDNL